MYDENELQFVALWYADKVPEGTYIAVRAVVGMAFVEASVGGVVDSSVIVESEVQPMNTLVPTLVTPLGSVMFCKPPEQ